jgi:hypothetical protein
MCYDYLILNPRKTVQKYQAYELTCKIEEILRKRFMGPLSYEWSHSIFQVEELQAFALL